MKKLILLFICATLFSCTNTKTIALNQTVILDYFYVESCGDCKAFKKKTIPTLQKTFGDKIEIEEYNLDDEDVQPLYDAIIGSLDNFDEALYGQGPFIVVEDYFAIIGFETSETDILIQDIVSATKDQPLSDELSIRRYLYL